MLGNILKILGVFAPYFSQESMAKRRRIKLKKLQRKLDDIMQMEATPRNRNRIARLMRDIARLQNSFSV